MRSSPHHVRAFGVAALVGATLVLRAALVSTDGRAELGQAEPEHDARHYWHWPLQSEDETGFSREQLQPEACGACHPRQLADWSTSRHSRAFGPGLLGQLSASGYGPDALGCSLCHAPLASQQPFQPMDPLRIDDETSQTHTEQAIAWLDRGLADLVPHDGFDPSLRNRGVVCAACHLRGGRVHAPPQRAKRPTIEEGEGTRHEAVVRTDVLESSDFCRPCHQFSAANAIAGKPLQDTYEEWRASPFASADVTCQHCHMPDRRHLWRGIHDPEWVGGALHLSFEALPRGTERIEVRLIVMNIGVGHRFPTYTTPLAWAELEIWPAGESAFHSIASRPIGWKVDLEGWREEFDTRIAPQDTLQVGIIVPPDILRGARVVGRVRVEPDHHYEGVYRDILTRLGDRPSAARTRIEQALVDAVSSGYVATEEEISWDELREVRGLDNARSGRDDDVGR